MRSQQLIPPLPKPLERIRPLEAVEVADAAAPIRQVDVVLRPGVSQRFSTSCAAASRAGAGLGADEGARPSAWTEPCISAAGVPFVVVGELRRRPRRRRNFRGGAAPFSVGGAPPSGAGAPLPATATVGVTGRGPYPRRRRRDRPPPAGVAPPTRCRRRSPRWRPPTAASMA